MAALQAVVDATPKPGLVDRANSGAHHDMDQELFLRSIEVLAPFFRRFALEGLSAGDAAPPAASRLGVNSPVPIPAEGSVGSG